MDQQLLQWLGTDKIPSDEEINTAAYKLQARLEKIEVSQSAVIAAFSNAEDIPSPLERALLKLNIENALSRGEAELAEGLNILLEIALKNQPKQANQQTEVKKQETLFSKLSHKTDWNNILLGGMIFLGLMLVPIASAVLLPAESRWYIYPIILFLYIYLRHNSWKAGEIRLFSDSEVYQRITKLPLLSKTFWIQGRPFTVPLFYKMLGNDQNHIVLFQLVFSTIAWSLLAIVCENIIPVMWLKPVALTGILMFSMHNDVIQWDKTILSESIALSIQSIFVASWLWLLVDWQTYKVFLMLIVGFFWLFTRDTNAYAFILLSGILILAVFLGWLPWISLVIAALYLIFFYLSTSSSEKGQRWVTPLYNVIGRRILLDSPALAWFQKQGMPVSAALMERKGHFAWDDDYRFYNAPALEDFNKWFHTQGKRTFMRYFLKDIGKMVQSPLLNPTVILPREIKEYASLKQKQIMPGWLDDNINPPSFLFLSAMLYGAGLATLYLNQHLYWVVALAMMTIAYGEATISWNGDAAETERHGLLASIQFRLGFWFSVFCMLLSVIGS